jgi:hypothetical protein
MSSNFQSLLKGQLKGKSGQLLKADAKLLKASNDLKNVLLPQGQTGEPEKDKYQDQTIQQQATTPQ